MTDNHIQASFNVGEWAPTLGARVDLQKYHSAAALLKNWTVDYRGGASTRPGTKYVLQCFKSATAVRLIPFQPAFNIGYVLEFGDFYIRFHFAGSPVLESATTISAAAAGPPEVFTDAAHGYSNGDWIFVQSNYYIVAGVTTNTYTLTDLFGVAITTNPFTLPASASRVYTIASPYAAADLAKLKFAQNVSQLILANSSYAPYVLQLISPTNWTLNPITFGTIVGTPTGVAITTTLGAGSVNYSYVVTAVGPSGEESPASAPGSLANILNMQTVAGSNGISWSAASGATSYNVYKSNVSYFGVVPVGVTYGFIGNTTGLSFVDTNIGPNFSITPPVARNPFAGGNNPSAVGFFQQRLVFAASVSQPQTFWMSQTGFFFNFDVSDPVQANNAITGTLSSGYQNTIRSMTSVASGLLMLTDRATWLINGGTGAGSAVSPSSIVANIQSSSGTSDVPPILANYDVLYVQAKGSVIRDNAYNIYYNVFTGTDVSVLSSHLFYGFTVLEWAWAEEPFKIVWAIRNDGTMLTLTFLKEQDFIGWTHSVTQGSFTSAATVTENTSTAGEVDAIYTVVQRTVNSQSLKYIERVVERTFPAGVADAWCVDAAIQYVGAPATNFSGAQHLAGLTVTGLADGQIIPPFVMPANGQFTLPAASKVTVGLGYTCDLQTLAVDIGEPTVQGKVKKIPSVTVRVADTLGLMIGSDFNHLVPMKDLVRGNVSSMLTGQQSQVVTDLVTGDANTYLDPTYTVPGQYCIRQSNPYPSTVLGVIPNVIQGDER